MDAVAFAAGQLADFFLLVDALEVERADIGAGLDFILAEGEKIVEQSCECGGSTSSGIFDNLASCKVVV